MAFWHFSFVKYLAEEIVKSQAFFSEIYVLSSSSFLDSVG